MNLRNAMLISAAAILGTFSEYLFAQTDEGDTDDWEDENEVFFDPDFPV